MPLDISCFQISADINACGTDVKMGDYKRVGVCLPYSDIIKGSIVYDGCKVNFSALPGAFAIYDKSIVPFNGSAISEEMGTRFMKYNELVVFPAFEHTPENAYAIYKMMQGGERFVVILEQEKPNATGTNRFQVFGMESGLKFKEGKSDKENQAANVVTLEQLNTGRPATYFYDTSDAVTIAKVDTLLAYDLIYGGTIATGGAVKFQVSPTKMGYIKLPNGTVLETVSAEINETYNGVGGSITYYADKTSAGVLLLASSVAGNLIYNGEAHLSLSESGVLGLIADKTTYIDANGSVNLADLVAPKAITCTAQGCALTAKSIGDILYQAYIDNRENVVYDFSGGTNAAYATIDSYLFATYAINIAPILVQLQALGGTITLN